MASAVSSSGESDTAAGRVKVLIMHIGLMRSLCVQVPSRQRFKTRPKFKIPSILEVNNNFLEYLK